jgi:hypothetical protein
MPTAPCCHTDSAVQTSGWQECYTVIPDAQTWKQELRRCWSNDLPDRPTMIICTRILTTGRSSPDCRIGCSTAVHEDVSAGHFRVVGGRIDVWHLRTRDVSGAKFCSILGDPNTVSERCFVPISLRRVQCVEHGCTSAAVIVDYQRR